jgi:hypothetical protein
LWLYRDLVGLRRGFGRGLRFIDAAPGVLAYRRGDRHLVALNLSQDSRPAPSGGTLLLGTHGERHGEAPEVLAPGNGFVALAQL